MNKVLIFGGTGFIGLRLAEYLRERGFYPILIARNPPEGKSEFAFRQWDASSVGAWLQDLDGASAVVNLAGKSVDCIKTPDNCDVILRSRVDATRTIGKAMQSVSHPPAVWIQMSTAHIYGDPPIQECTEDSATGYGLAPFVGRAWEKAFLESIPSGVREVRLRTSFVIGKNGGALRKLKRITRLGLGGKAGHGRQGMSWIHEDDLNALIYTAISNTQYSGIYVASAPHPVSNIEFMRTLRRKMGVPIGLPATAFMTRIGARMFFRTDPELILYGRYVRSERLAEAGFQFKYPRLPEALDDLIQGQ